VTQQLCCCGRCCSCFAAVLMPHDGEVLRELVPAHSSSSSSVG
jgi:hypothetical protein